MLTQDQAKTTTKPHGAGAVTVQESPWASTTLLNPSEILILAIWFGVLTGLLELAVVCFGMVVLGSLAPEFPDSLWMIPLAHALTFAVPGLFLALLTWGWRRVGSVSFVLFWLGSLTAVCLLCYAKSLHPLARILLAIGFAAQLARMLGRNPGFLRSLVQGSVCWVWPFQRKPTVPDDPVPERSLDPEPILDRRQVLASSAAVVGTMFAGVEGSRFLQAWHARSALPPAQGKTNILFLVLDTVRAQSLSLYGYSRPTSPQLEKWARKGVCFRRAIATAPWTLPSHVTMFTGRHIHETGVDLTVPYTSAFPTLAEVLRDSGYETAGFVANTEFLCPVFGLDRGFTHYECYAKSLGQILHASQFGKTITKKRRLRRILGAYDDLGRKSAGDLNRALLTWLGGRDRQRPYFAFLNYFDAHGPYVPSRKTERAFGGRVPADPQPDIWHSYRPEEIDAFRDAYDRCILDLDRELGRLLDHLHERGELENTLVVITADHGELFGEHGLLEHTWGLYLPLLHVPLLMFHPSLIPGGSTVIEPASLGDLPRTILSLAGVASEDRIPGVSLASHWKTGKRAHPLAHRPALSETNAAPEWVPKQYPASKGSMRSLIWEKHHYIQNGDGSEELYHIDNDPHEAINLAGRVDSGTLLERFRAALAEFGSVAPRS